MRMLLGFAIVMLLAIPSHAYFPIQCNDTHAADDFTKADVVIVGQVAGFERFTEIFVGKGLKGEEYKETFFSYYAKVKIGRVVTGTLKVDDEIWVFEGYGSQPKENNADPHWIKQCNTHARAGLGLGCAYVLALNLRKPDERNADKRVCYNPRSCHHSLHDITEVVNEESGKRWFGVKVAEEEGKPAHYVTVDDFLAHMRKRAESVPAK